MGKKQRLIVCLDGTWNNKDDSTNVLHHFALVRKGEVPDGQGGVINQRKFYHPGVGTGVLDRITGGGFGFGLEENVRHAYDWLVQEYQDGDEIYIFGFSRGAYTARSLVGFIGSCGLLRRGAPLTVNQLWGNYCILGRQREEHAGFWERTFGETPAKIRPITELICDPWGIDHYEKVAGAFSSDGGSEPGDRVPGQKQNDLNATEKLLVRWSRRVRITFLGVYDTVGAIGIDALAIPGLKSKLALHHNMRPTTLIQRCRHALAMDEHRSSFSQTPFLAYLGHETDSEKNESDSEDGKEPKPNWERTRAMWKRKIEQRWFVGAHSNIGGGYANNRLAQRPLAWMLESAIEQGLVCENLPSVLPIQNALPSPVDSYEEFARPFSTMIFRSKRNYRTIDPEPELRASHDRKPEAGFSLESINEQIDDSVFQYWKEEKWPPQLVEWKERKSPKKNASASVPENTKPRHVWLGHGNVAPIVLVFWATLAAVGLASANEFICGRHGTRPPLWLMCGVAFAFALVDWAESRVNFFLALKPMHPCARAFRDSVYWTRALGVVLFALATVTAFSHVWLLGWKVNTIGEAWAALGKVVHDWWLIPVFAGAGGIAAEIADRVRGGQRKQRFTFFAIGSLAASLAVPMTILVAALVGQIFAPMLSGGARTPPITGSNVELAGLLLLLQFGVIYFLDALAWVGEPMSKANLHSIVRLQFCITAKQVEARLENWRRMLACRRRANDATDPNGLAARAMRATVSEALWRDIFGFIPLYSVVLGFGLWFAATKLGWTWLNQEVWQIPLWLFLPTMAALADYVENVCHLEYLARHERGEPQNGALTMLAFLSTLIKFAGFIPALLLTGAAIFWASWKLALLEDDGWRGSLALLISTLAIVMVFAGVVLYRWRAGRKDGK